MTPPELSVSTSQTTALASPLEESQKLLSPVALPISDDAREDDIVSASRLKRFSNIILYSRHYLVFYSLLMVLQLAMFAYAAVRTQFFRDALARLPWWFVWLDTAVIALLLLELGLRLSASGRRFFAKCSNVVDLVLVCLCALTVPLYFAQHRALLLSLALTIARYAAQLGRLVLSVRLQLRRARAAAAADNSVSFPDGYATFSPSLEALAWRLEEGACLATDDARGDGYVLAGVGCGGEESELDGRIAEGLAVLSRSYRSTHVPPAEGGKAVAGGDGQAVSGGVGDGMGVGATPAGSWSGSSSRGRDGGAMMLAVAAVPVGVAGSSEAQPLNSS
jgi:hypothetical protein